MKETVTLALDEELLQRARELAHRQGTNLNEWVGRCLERAVVGADCKSAAVELIALFRSAGGRSGDGQLGRSEADSDRT